MNSSTRNCCGGGGGGPGWATPADAFCCGQRERFLIVTCPAVDAKKTADMVATVDVESKSDSYCKVCGRSELK